MSLTHSWSAAVGIKSCAKSGYTGKAMRGICCLRLTHLLAHLHMLSTQKIIEPVTAEEVTLPTELLLVHVGSWLNKQRE